MREYQNTPFPLDGAVRIKPLEIRPAKTGEKQAFLVFDRIEAGVGHRLSFDWSPRDGEFINLKGTVTLYDANENILHEIEINQPHARVSTIGEIRYFHENSPKPAGPMTLRVDGDLAKFVTPERNWHVSKSTESIALQAPLNTPAQYPPTQRTPVLNPPTQSPLIVHR